MAFSDYSTSLVLSPPRHHRHNRQAMDTVRQILGIPRDYHFRGTGEDYFRIIHVLLLFLAGTLVTYQMGNISKLTSVRSFLHAYVVMAVTFFSILKLRLNRYNSFGGVIFYFVLYGLIFALGYFLSLVVFPCAECAVWTVHLHINAGLLALHFVLSACYELLK